MRRNKFSEVAPNFMGYDGYDYDNTKSSDVDNYEGSFAQKYQKERSVREAMSNREIALTAGAVAALIAIGFGIDSCKNKVADSSLEKLGCLENYQKFNLDNQEGLLHSAGFGNTHSKAMYAAIVENARENGMSIEESARNLTSSWKKKLSSEYKNLNAVINQAGGIKGVNVTNSDGTRVVEVIYQYRKAHTTGSGDSRRTYYTTETDYVYIPCSEANQYGVDDEVVNGHHTVNMGGATFEFDESKLSERIGPGLKRELDLVKELVASGDCADESMVADTIMHCPEDFPNLFPLATNPKLYNRKFLPLIEPYVDMAFGMRTH